MNMDDNDVESALGTVKFPLDKIEKQEEYDLELEIPDEYDERIINAKINAKIRFVWSTYKYYQDLYAKSERVLQNYNAMLTRTFQLIENLNEPLKYFNVMEDNFENQKEIVRDGSSNILRSKGGNINIGAGGTTNVNHTKQYQYADQVEDFIKNTLSKFFLFKNILEQPNIKWMGLIKIFIIISIVLAFINTFIRSDFINIIVPTIIVVIFYTSLNSNTVGNLKLFLILIAGALGYDILWFLFSASVSNNIIFN